MVTEDEDDNEVVEMQEIEETTLTVYLHHTTPEQMSAAYGFTEQQNEHLALLRHEEYSVMWASLLGGFTHGGGMIGSDADWVGTGIFAWPLPQSFTITSQFGYRTDPFTGEISYHSGTDIAVFTVGGGFQLQKSCGSGGHGDSCKRDRPVGRKLWILRKDTA